MSRFGGDYESEVPPDFWWHNVEQVYKSKRGKRVLLEVKAALAALPKRRLLGGQFADLIYNEDGDITGVGEVCVIGAYCYAKGMEPRHHHETEDMNEFETAEAGEYYGMSRVMAWDLSYRNDESFGELEAGARWFAMYGFICKKLLENPY